MPSRKLKRKNLNEGRDAYENVSSENESSDGTRDVTRGRDRTSNKKRDRDDSSHRQQHRHSEEHLLRKSSKRGGDINDQTDDISHKSRKSSSKKKRKRKRGRSSESSIDSTHTREDSSSQSLSRKKDENIGEERRRRRNGRNGDHRQQLSDSADETADERGESTPEPADEGQPDNDLETSKKRERREATSSLSIEETNKLRLSLGLTPLDVDGDKPPKTNGEMEKKAEMMGGTLIAGSIDNEIHMPAVNLGSQKLGETMRLRLEERRRKRELEKRLLIVQTLGQSSTPADADKLSQKLFDREGKDDDEGEDDVLAWIGKQEMMDRHKREAEKREKALNELDDAFGVDDLLHQSAEKSKNEAYTATDLSGMKIGHSMSDFSDTHRSMILTLKDSNVLDETVEDTLINVNVSDDVRAREKLRDASKTGLGYNAFDNEYLDTETEEVKRRSLLYQYDDNNVEKAESAYFRLSESSNGISSHKTPFDGNNPNPNSVVMKNKLKESLKVVIHSKLNSDFFTDEEMKFKKGKSKKKSEHQKRGGETTENPRKTHKKALRKHIKDEENADDGIPSQERVEIVESDNLIIKREDEVNDTLASSLEVLRRKRLEKLRTRGRQSKKAAIAIDNEYLFSQLDNYEVKKEEDGSKGHETEQSDFFGQNYDANVFKHESMETYGEEEDNRLETAKNLIVLDETGEFCRNISTSYERNLDAFAAQQTSNNRTSFKKSRNDKSAIIDRDEEGRKEEKVESVSANILHFERSLVDEAQNKSCDSTGMDNDDDSDEVGRGGEHKSTTLNNTKSSRHHWHSIEDESKEGSGRPKKSSNSTRSKSSGKKAQKTTAGESTDGEETKEFDLLEDEPNLVHGGLASALKMAKRKGYIASNDHLHSKNEKFEELRAKNFLVENKDESSSEINNHRGDRGNNHRGGGRSSFNSGRFRSANPPSSSRVRDHEGGGATGGAGTTDAGDVPLIYSEKKNYQPKLNLEYVDDEGREMNVKEAFRYLSHKFHGKGSGKTKTEKRMKKLMESSGFRSHLSTSSTSHNSNFNSLEKLKKRQVESKTPYLILTGNSSSHSVENNGGGVDNNPHLD